ncbi:LysR substrate-binding domain-containing protein [Bacillus sp. FSL R12-0069]|uniref:LysR substrate-binding domain-containing protein n=1 Tax=Bacillus sp. FSL R12-0069 TaxID=2975342 RepID=UPI004046BC72
MNQGNVLLEQSLIMGMLFNLAKFSAPAFIFIFGFHLIRHYTKQLVYKEYISEKAAHLLIPYLFWSILYLLTTNDMITLQGGIKSVYLHEVKDEPFISMNTGYGFRHLTDEFCKEAGFTPYIAFEVDEPTVISDLIKQGLGIAFVPSLTLLKNSTLALNKLRIIEPICKRTIGLSWSKKRYLSKTAQQFREFVIHYFSNIRT